MSETSYFPPADIQQRLETCLSDQNKAATITERLLANDFVSQRASELQIVNAIWEAIAGLESTSNAWAELCKCLAAYLIDEPSVRKSVVAYFHRIQCQFNKQRIPAS